MLFLSTPSGWRATKLAAFLNKMLEISIHALRVEGDSLFNLNVWCKYKISIHALRVEGDLVGGLVKKPRYTISIHALRVEGDPFF